MVCSVCAIDSRFAFASCAADQTPIGGTQGRVRLAVPLRENVHAISHTANPTLAHSCLVCTCTASLQFAVSEQAKWLREAHRLS